MRFKKLTSLLFALSIATQSANAASTQWSKNNDSKSETRLIASFYQDKQGLNPTKKLIAAVHFKIAAGWKIYGDDKSAGINDGIGVPPSFDFANSTNISGTKILWPQANIGEEDIGSTKLKFSYFKDEVVIPIEIEITDPQVETNIVIKLDYGICKEVCIPVSENLTLRMIDEVDQSILQQIQPFLTNKKITEIEPIVAEVPQAGAAKKVSSIFYVILLGILGGMILNVMPCVLPVISIKLLSIIYAAESYKQRHETLQPTTIRFAFISTIIGILSCFAAFAVIAGIIKLTGSELGWGFQFQNPHFLIFLIAILTIFSANLMGFFEFNFDRFLSNFLNRKISEIENREEMAKRKSIFVVNFLSGILAVILATPCSAPFLGAAISFALANNFLVILLVFLSIGVGFSAPYIAMIISPKLIEFLPKPGNWMVQLKKIMTLMLVITVLWLIHVLSNTIGNKASLLIIFCSFVLLFSFKIRLSVVRYFTLLVVLVTMFSSSFVSYKSTNVYEEKWWKFDETEISRQVAMGNVVFIDITADWCITCKFNKLRVLQDQRVMNVLQGGDIVIMRGDITKPNPEIMKFMQKHNRFAIPFNAVYGPNAPQGLLTSEILSKTEIFQLIAKAAKVKE